MTCRELLERDHQGMDVERFIRETCPQDHGYKAKGPLPCLQSPYWQDCSSCWDREAEE